MKDFEYAKKKNTNRKNGGLFILSIIRLIFGACLLFLLFSSMTKSATTATSAEYGTRKLQERFSTMRFPTFWNGSKRTMPTTTVWIGVFLLSGKKLLSPKENGRASLPMTSRNSLKRAMKIRTILNRLKMIDMILGSSLNPCRINFY